MCPQKPCAALLRNLGEVTNSNETGSDLVERVLSTIAWEKVRIRSYEGLIFLCGGDFETDTRGNPEPPLKSVRDLLRRRAFSDPDISSKIRIAEDTKNWGQEATYKDLLSFENDLAVIASLIVLPLESPGCLAELGVFATSDVHRSKLLVFIDEEHYSSPSFIKLGLIDHLEKLYHNTSDCHSWHKRHGSKLVFCPTKLESIADDLIAEIKNRFKKESESDFNKDNQKHIMLLIIDLIDLFGVLKLNEIRTALQKLDIEIKEDRLKQLLFTLESVEFISKKAKGKHRYYKKIAQQQYTTITFKDSKTDFVSRKAAILDELKKIDNKRYRAITEDQ